MLEVKNLSSGYNGKAVIEGITLSIPENKLISVIGPNGSGKSTFLKALAGVNPIFDGEISLDGKAFSEFKGSDWAKEVSFLSQGRNIPDMTVKQLVLHGRFPYLDYPRRYKDIDRKIAENSIDKMGIENMADRPVATLSGGERQKAYIAMALTQDTDYILLDEPTTYLDISHQTGLMKTLKDLSQNGKSVISVMHDLPFALNFSDLIIVMREGKMISFDTSEKIYQSNIVKEVFGVKLKNIDGQYQYDIF